VFLVDKPGAAQSVIRMNRFVRHRLDEDYTSLMFGNHVIGGMFMARLNMNLREDKGYTYGARSYLSHGHGPSRWILSTSVKSDVTRLALDEILLELEGLAYEPVKKRSWICRVFCREEVHPEPRPITEDDVAYFSSNLVNGYPSRFEDASYVLTSQAAIRLYGLPADWLSGFMDRVESVDASMAQEAFVADVASQPWNIIIVGDLATIRESIEGLGYPVTELDADGNLVQAEESRED
jgi:zinc protease